MPFKRLVQAITLYDTTQQRQGIKQVALSRCVRAKYDRQRPEVNFDIP